MRIDIVTIFPDYLDPLELSLVGRARATGLLDVRVHDLRAWTTDRHRTVDDAPFGGGAGMVMRPDIWGAALDDLLDGVLARAAPGTPGRRGDVSQPGTRLVVPTPSGQVFDQRMAAELAGVGTTDVADRTGTADVTGAAQAGRIVIACGRYEGIDARVVDHYRRRVPVTELSLGDYVLGGGEVAALVIVEAVARLLPGVVGNPESLVEESHGAAGLLEYPVYTRPPVWRDHAVPPELLTGHHAQIQRWRRDQALRRTAERRPDLLVALDPTVLDEADRAVLARAGWTGSDGPISRPAAGVPD